MFWGRHIRNRFGQAPMTGLTVLLVNDLLSVSLSEDSGFYYNTDVPLGVYNLKVNGVIVPFYSPITIFGVAGGGGGGGWGEGGWGEGPFGDT